jgi:cytochrome c oxidase cbb3-type subunit 3
MYSRYRAEIAFLVVALLCGCESRSAHPPPADTQAAADNPAVTASALVPGFDHSVPTTDARADAYYDNPEAVVTGRRLFGQYNCSGCHSNGGGGMGPSLMDDEWIYGGRLEQIHQTLVEGRPNGMPAWGGKVTDEQLWQLAAYVRSMSLPATLAAQQGPTPSKNPMALPRGIEDSDGWRLAPGTTNDYTSVTTGPK